MVKYLKIIIVSIFETLICLIGFSIIWCLNTWQRLSMDELIYELSAPLKGTGSDMITQFFLKCIIPTLAVTAILIVASFKLKKKYIITYGLIATSVFTVILVVVLCNRLHVFEYISNMGDDSSFIEDHYVDAGNVNLSFPDKKRNLIYIFLESMEMTYSDIENGGGFTYNMIPELTELAEENECFSGDDKLNGAYVTYGTTWTMGGMFAQTSGLPLKILVEENSMSGESSFFPGITCIGDILAGQGYNQELLIGSEAVFGGRKLYFSEHGNYVMHDYDYAINNGIIPKDYKVFWGYEDTKLFENAKNDLIELSQKDEPFNLTMLTVDTHFPDGYVCDLCVDKFKGNQYANVMACSSGQVKAFIEWIKKQDFYDNTTIVLCGDHTTMNGDFCADISKDYERKVYSVVINPAVEKCRKESIRYSTIDMFPTTLAALGVQIEGNRLGLGTNLFSNEKTLIEKYGTSEVDSQFKKKSAFIDNLSGMLDEAMMAKKGWLPDAEVGITSYDKENKSITVKAENIINVDKCKKVTATLYDASMNKIDTYEMQMDYARNYSCKLDIGALKDRIGTVIIEAVGKKNYKIGELSGDLSVCAHENFGEYVDLLKNRENIAILFAANGDFTSSASDKDLDELKKLGIDEKLSGQGYVSFYGVVDNPSIVYGAGEERIDFDGSLVGNDVPYHLESEAGDTAGACSIMIDGNEYALNEKGLNCVVYDYELKKVIDSAAFDISAIGEVSKAKCIINVEQSKKDHLHISIEDVSNHKIWKCNGVLWDKKHVNKPLELKFTSDDDIIFNTDVKIKEYDITDAYLEIYATDSTEMQIRYIDWNGDLLMISGSFENYLNHITEDMDNKIIFMSSKDNMGLSDDKDVVDALGKLGLSGFSKGGDHSVWNVVMTKDGVTEKCEDSEVLFEDEYRGTKYSVKSSGWYDGYCSSIIINGEEYSKGGSGINIVVYNTETERVEDSVTYCYVYRGEDYKTFVR